MTNVKMIKTRSVCWFSEEFKHLLSQVPVSFMEDLGGTGFAHPHEAVEKYHQVRVVGHSTHLYRADVR